MTLPENIKPDETPLPPLMECPTHKLRGIGMPPKLVPRPELSLVKNSACDPKAKTPGNSRA